jgi:flavin-dependent dehydrogenase
VIDLLVGGGGPAGLATALYAARAGLEVVVVERRDGVLDKACGEGMMPHTLAHLDRLGVVAKGRTLRGITYVDGERRVDSAFRAGTGLGVRRTVLHAALREAAEDADVRFVHGDVGEISQDADSVLAGEVRARYLAAADGLHSPIRSALGLSQPCGGARRWGIRRHYDLAPWTESVEVHWARGPEAGEAYVTPVADDRVGIAMLSSTRGGFDSHFDEFPELKERVAGHAHGQDRAAGPLRQKARHRRAGRVLLVGDAAGYIDALTGEGMGLAFGAAELLVDCVVAGRVGEYDRRWRRLTRRYRLLTAALVGATAHASVRSRIVPAAVALPRVFDHAVNQLAY